MNKIEICPQEDFIHLSDAPIVEAVIEIKAKSEIEWKEEVVKPFIDANLPDYPHRESGRILRQEVTLESGSKAPAKQTIKDLGWRGFKLKPKELPHIVQFNRDGFVFSRLFPYNDWVSFSTEALRLWKLYDKLAKPAGIQRIGVRFINRIKVEKEPFQLEDYFQICPDTPRDLELIFTSFMHRDILSVPGHDYIINIIKTIQPAQASKDNATGLILDIDVSTSKPPKLGDDIIDKKINEMHWLKNKAFFGIITPKTLELCK